MSSFWGIVFYIRNIILLGLTTKNTTHLGKTAGFLVVAYDLGAQGLPPGASEGVWGYMILLCSTLDPCKS